MENGDDQRREDLGWEKRVLCSDEGCIGTIGPDGRCKECGLPYQGELPAGFYDQAVSADDQDRDAVDRQDSEQDRGAPAENETENETESETGSETGSEAETSDSEDEWERRKLCRDESCIGIIGEDGRCKECGLPYDDH